MIIARNGSLLWLNYVRTINNKIADKTVIWGDGKDRESWSDAEQLQFLEDFSEKISSLYPLRRLLKLPAGSYWVKVNQNSIRKVSNGSLKRVENSSWIEALDFRSDLDQILRSIHVWVTQTLSPNFERLLRFVHQWSLTNQWWWSKSSI